MIELIIAAIKSTKDKRAKAAQIKAWLNNQEQTLFSDPIEDMDKAFLSAVNEELKKGKGSRITRDAKGIYRVARKTTPPPPPPPLPKPEAIYEGTAGEMAVISELLFREFNANKMMIDKGIDIVAAKNNIYYYVQVKTSYIQDGKVRWQIKKERFDTYVINQLKYVFVARFYEKNKYKEGDYIGVNMFFILSSSDIDRESSNGYISMSEDNISVKIEFDAQSGEPYLYNDGKRIEAKYYMNNFKW